MKRALMALWIIALCLTLQAQTSAPGFLVTTSTPLNVTLTNSDTAVVYFLFPDNNSNWYASETLPDRYYTTPNQRALAWWSSGDVYLMLEPNASTGMAANETDSLTSSIQPLVWDAADGEFAVIETDSTHLVFDTAGTYTSTTQDWLDWTTGQEYGCLLTGQLCPVAGFALTLIQRNAGAGIGIYTLQLYSTRMMR